VYTLERAVACLPPGQDKLCWVIDFSGFSTRLTGLSNMQMSKRTLHLLQNHYPERLGMAILLNAPFVFTVFWKLVSPFIDENTKKKVLLLKHQTDERNMVDWSLMQIHFISEKEKLAFMSAHLDVSTLEVLCPVRCDSLVENRTCVGWTWRQGYLYIRSWRVDACGTRVVRKSCPRISRYGARANDDRNRQCGVCSCCSWIAMY